MSSLLNEKCILFDVLHCDKKSVIKDLLENLKNEGYIHDIKQVYNDIIERENIFPTSFGHRIAIPHGRSHGVSKPGICFAKLKNDILWDNQAKEYVGIVILVIVPTETNNDTHLKIISRLARLLIHEDYVHNLIEANKEKVLAMLQEGLEE